MADQIIHEMIAAFSVGCMDKQNFVQFKEYMQQDGELPDGEMGELQNIVAMIPIILDIEIPHTSIKDKVAKRLIEIKDEIKAKILNERKSSSTFSKTFTVPIEGQDEISFKNTKTQSFSPRLTNINLKQTRTSKDDFAEYLEKKKTKTLTKDQTGIKAETTNQEFVAAPLPPVKEDTFESIPKKPETYVQTKAEEVKTSTVQNINEAEENKPSSWVAILSIIISLLLFTVLGYYSFINIQKLNNKITDLQNELNTAKDQLSAANNFLENYYALVEFFNNKDIVVINLQAANDSISNSAKLLLSFSEKSGLIQFKNLKNLQTDKAFQLWAVRRNQAVSMGVFQPSGNEFLRITQFPPMPKEQIDYYKITIEPTNGASEPSSNLVLTSQFTR
jgi:hypothetical protein